MGPASNLVGPPRAGRSRTPRPPTQRAGRTLYILTAGLGVAAALAAALTVAYPGVLTGSVGANGNMRGTALVVLCVGVPVLAGSVLGALRGSARALVVWLGTLGYLLYQAVMFAFATPFNQLFLVYVAYLGLSVWTMAAVLRRTDLSAFEIRLSRLVPMRAIAGYALLVAALNAAAWLSRIVPAVLSDHPRAFLTSSGLLTDPVYVQDLAIWLPLLTAAAIAAWRHQVWGRLITGAMLVLFVLESISIAVDQWFGSAADPTSPDSSMVMVPAFAAVALITAVPLVAFLRNVDRPAPD